MTPRPVVFDTDMALGTPNADIDDAVALLLALDEPALDVLAVTGTGGNASINHACRNIDSLLATVGHQAIPHSWCATLPLDSSRWVKHRWEANEKTEQPFPDTSFTSSDLIRKTLRESARAVTVICIGPLTNLALALATEPMLCSKIDSVVMMGGSFRMPGVAGGPSEFNILCDPEAAALVFSMPLKIYLFGLDVTKKRPVYPVDIESWNLPDHPFLKYLYENCIAFMHHRAKRDGYDTPYSFFHDALPVLYLKFPQWFTMTPCSVKIDLCGTLTRGMTIIDPKVDASAATCWFATDVDESAILAYICDSIVRKYMGVPYEAHSL